MNHRCARVMRSDISVIAFVWVAGVVLVWVNEVVGVGKLWGVALCSAATSSRAYRPLRF